MMSIHMKDGLKWEAKGMNLVEIKERAIIYAYYLQSPTTT